MGRSSRSDASALPVEPRDHASPPDGRPGEPPHGPVCRQGRDFHHAEGFPHFDSAFPNAFEHFMQIPNVSNDSRRKILWDNCARLYNLN